MLTDILKDMPYSQAIGQSGSNLPIVLDLIEMRFRDIENKVYKKKKTTANRPQKFLIMYHLGLLDKLFEKNITVDKKARLLSIILDEDYDNLHQNISEVGTPKSSLLIK